MGKTYFDPEGYEFVKYPAAKLTKKEWAKFLALDLNPLERAIILALHKSGNKPATSKQVAKFLPLTEPRKEVLLSTQATLAATISCSDEVIGFIFSTNNDRHWIARFPNIRDAQDHNLFQSYRLERVLVDTRLARRVGRALQQIRNNHQHGLSMTLGDLCDIPRKELEKRWAPSTLSGINRILKIAGLALQK